MPSATPIPNSEAAQKTTKESTKMTSYRDSRNDKGKNDIYDDQCP